MARAMLCWQCHIEGHILTENDIAIKSPSGALPPYEFDNVIGLALKQSVDEDDDISFEILGSKA